LLRRLRSVALVNPGLQDLDGHVAVRKRRGHPSALAEAVLRRLGVRKEEPSGARVRQLARDAERLAGDAQVRKRLVIDGEVHVPRPRTLRVRPRVSETEGPQLGEGLVRGDLLTRHPPPLLYFSRFVQAGVGKSLSTILHRWGPLFARS